MPAAAAPKLLVVGSLNMDLVLRADRLPFAGESLPAEFYQYIPGGKGGNQAVAVARQGGKPTFIGCVGNDAHGVLLASGLRREHVDTSHLQVSRSASSGLAVIFLDNRSQNRILVFAGANHEVKTSAVIAAFRSQRYDGVLLNLEIPDAIILRVLAEAKIRNLPVILDAGPARHFTLAKLRNLEILSPNETEVQAMTGRNCRTWKDTRSAAISLRKSTGARHVVIKLGARGALLHNAYTTRRFHPYAVDAVDTTAAGDAFTSALAVTYIETGDINTAVHRAMAAGAIAVTCLGAQPSLPTRRAVDLFLRRRH
jgi:ribokinase